MYLDTHRDRGSRGYLTVDKYDAVFGWGKVISSVIIGPGGSQRLSFFPVSFFLNILVRFNMSRTDLLGKKRALLCWSKDGGGWKV